MSPDPACWGEIEEKLEGKRKSLPVRRVLYIAAAAVAALLLLISIPWNKEEVAPVAEISEKAEPAREAVKEEKAELPPPEIKTLIASASRPAKRKEVIQEEKEPEMEPAKEPGKTEEVPAAKEKEDYAMPGRRNEVIIHPVKQKRKSNWQVGTSFGTGGGYSLMGSGEMSDPIQNDASNGGGGITVPPESFDKALQPEDYDDISHNIPISVGITASKQLSKRVAVETGLVYTYLSSDLEGSNRLNAKGKLGLHYLGIPVNLIVDLWSSRDWKVYLSGGAMAEKGLRSIYTQHIYRNNTTETTTFRTSISGIQWSLNGSLGVSYRIYKDWSIYAEPRISYFFDNYQPISTRTEHPVTFGIGAGVRFAF